MEKIPMTPEGLAMLEEENKRLSEIERPAVIRAIAEAREHGDLSENAEYHAARERQSFIEGRLKELKGIIGHADVIDASQLSGDMIRFGATVTLADEKTDEEITYRIVGSHEADVAMGKLSVTAPLGRALIGKILGDQAEVTTPGGTKYYEVIKVVYK